MDNSAMVRPRKSAHYHSLLEDRGGVAAGAVESLPDELLLLILSKAAAAAASPVDLANLALTSSRFARLVREPPVLSRLPLRALVPSARLWASAPATSAGESEPNAARSSYGACDGERNAVTDLSGVERDKCRMACRFLLQCGLAGSADALYVLGMIKFYCHRDFWAGASLLVWAAEKGHVAAIYSLAIIHSHGSGGGSSDGNPAAATDILWHAARAGSKQALQELGHCYLDGHGVPQRTLLGARLLLAAMCPALANSPHSSPAVQSAAVGLQLQRVRGEARDTARQSHRGQEVVVQSHQQNHQQQQQQQQRQQQQQQLTDSPVASTAAIVTTGVVQEPPQARRWLLEECGSEVRGAGVSASTLAAATPPPDHNLTHSLHSAGGASAQTMSLNARSRGAPTVSLQPVSLQGSTSLSLQPLRGQQGPVISIVRCAAGCHTAISVLSHSSPTSGCAASPHALAPCSSSSAPAPRTATSRGGFEAFAPSRLATGSRADLASYPSNIWQVRDAPWAAESAGTNTGDDDQGWRMPAVAAAPAVLGAAGVDINLEAAAAAAAAEQHGLTSKIAELFAPSGENGSGTEPGQGQAGFEGLASADAGMSGGMGVGAGADAGSAAPGSGASAATGSAGTSHGHTSMASFFRDWNALHGWPDGCKMCENAQCGRPETRAHEFRRCVVCERAAYCSRYCQVMDWKRIHYRVCKSGGTHTH